jgi:glutamate carboxypeptidase
MVGAEAVREALRGELPAMLDETERLAAIDSGSYDGEGVDRVSHALGELLAERGFTIAVTPLDGRGSQLSATRTLGRGRRLLVLGHADTVWPAGTVAEWPVERTPHTLAGPGVGDMKACLVMAVHALDAAIHAGVDGIGAIELLVVPDEELGSPGSRTWIEERARGAGACLGLEAGWPGGGVVVARGAVGALHVAASGRSAHCAGHEGEGASAVAALAPLVAELERCGRPSAGARVSVGVFRGGVARQVVPDRAELDVDLRAPDAAAAEALLAGVLEAVRRQHHEGVEIECQGGFTRPVFPETASRDLWALAQRRAHELALPLHPVRARGGSDASFAAALGVPTLDGLGPICHDSCARGERVEIASIPDRAALMACLVCDLAAQWRR